MRRLAPWLLFPALCIGIIYLFFHFFGSKIVSEERIYTYVNKNLQDRFDFHFKYKGFYIHFPRSAVFSEVEIFHKEKFLFTIKKLALELTYDFDTDRPIHPVIKISRIKFTEYENLQATLKHIRFPRSSPTIDKNIRDKKTVDLSGRFKRWFRVPDILIDKGSFEMDDLSFTFYMKLKKMQYLTFRLLSPYGPVTVKGNLEKKKAGLSVDLEYPMLSEEAKINASSELSFEKKPYKISDIRAKIALPEHPSFKYPTQYVLHGEGESQELQYMGNFKFLAPKNIRTSDPKLIGELKVIIPIKNPKLARIEEMELEISNWLSTYFDAKRVFLSGTLSLSNHHFKVGADDLILELPFLKDDVFVESIEDATWNNWGASVPMFQAEIDDRSYSAIFHSEDIRDTINLIIDATAFDLGMIKRRPKPDKRRKQYLPVPRSEIEARVENFEMDGLSTSSLSGKIYAWTNEVRIDDVQGEIMDSKVSMNGVYSIGDKTFLGDYLCEEVSPSTLNKIFGEEISLEGLLSLQGSIEHELGNAIFISSTLSNETPSLVLKNTSLQKHIWEMPYISSKKSYQDILLTLSSQIETTFEKNKFLYSIKSFFADFGEYQVSMTGNLVFFDEPSIFDARAQIFFFFSEYFKDNYINPNEAVDLYASDSKNTFFQKPDAWENYDLIKINVNRKDGVLKIETERN